MHRPVTHHNRGFTLVEVIVATTLVFVLMITLVGLTSLSLKSAQISRSQGEATKLAQAEMELLRAFRDKNGLVALKCSATSPTLGAPTPTVTPTAGSLNHWKMDEMSGNAVLDSVGTVTGTAYNTTITTGKFNRARNFNGTNAYVEFSNSSDLNKLGGPSATDFTVSAWVNVRSLPIILGELLYPAVIKIGTNNKYWLIGPHRVSQADQRGYFSFRLYNGAGVGYSINSAVTAITNQWYLLTGVKQGTIARIYLNGSLAAPTATIPATDYSHNDPLRLAYAGSWGFFDGIIDEVRIFNRALTSQEIANLYAESTITPSIAPTPPLGVGCYLNATLDTVTTGQEQIAGVIPGITFLRYYQTLDSPDCTTAGSGDKVLTTVYVTWTDAKGTHKSRQESCLTDWQQ